jgi:ATP-dependent Lon protease
VGFDLSKVMFITTANWLETIPGPLLDRMEVIQLSGYTENEKIAIARGYLIPRQIRENGLRSAEITFEDEALQTVIRAYTREAGVRNLEREIGRICRKVVTRIAEGTTDRLTVTAQVASDFLGKPRFFGTEEVAERTAVPGVATGLAWTPAGGEVLFIEATAMPGGKNFQLTGSLGPVMQESARAALSYVRSRADDLAARTISGPPRHPPAYPRRRPAQGWAVGRRDDGVCPGLARDRAPCAARCRDDGRDHAAREGASHRGPEGESPRRPPGRAEERPAAPAE